MIGLMLDAKLRVSEAVSLIWGDVRRLHSGSGRVRVGGLACPILRTFYWEVDL